MRVTTDDGLGDSWMDRQTCVYKWVIVDSYYGEPANLLSLFLSARHPFNC